jgi:hypothetical protein
VATIDTILSFYLAFLYANFHNYGNERLLCMASFLFEVEQKNRLEQRGLLKRFSMNCYGKQPTLEEIRSEKALKYKELKNDTKNKEYQNWFLKYVPRDLYKSKTVVSAVVEEKGDENQDENVDTDENKPTLFDYLLPRSKKSAKKTFRQRLNQLRKTRKTK